MIGWIALAGGAGAVARHALDLGLTALLARGGRGASRRGRALAVVNVTGSLAIGVLAGLGAAGAVGSELRTVLATGFLGGYTTFSAASLDVVERDGDSGRAAAVRRAIVVPVAAVAACAVGLVLGSLAA